MEKLLGDSADKHAAMEDALKAAQSKQEAAHGEWLEERQRQRRAQTTRFISSGLPTCPMSASRSMRPSIASCFEVTSNGALMASLGRMSRMVFASVECAFMVLDSSGIE